MALSKITAGSTVKLADINDIIDAVNNVQTSSNPVRNDYCICSK